MWRACAALLATCLTCMPAHAADPGRPVKPVLPRFVEASALPSWYIHAGLGGIVLSESAKMTAFGHPIVGGNISIPSQRTPVVEVGYFFTPNIAVSVTGGIPPKIDIFGKGTIAPLGPLGRAVYGPTAATIHYHLVELGPIQPYVGVGLAFMKIFGTEDRALNNIRMKDALGPVLQVGVDLMIDRNWGAFIDVKKAFLRTTATATLGGAPIHANVKVDPLVIHSGITYRF